jgi:hypothetical protein
LEDDDLGTGHPASLVKCTKLIMAKLEQHNALDRSDHIIGMCGILLIMLQPLRLSILTTANIYELSLHPARWRRETEASVAEVGLNIGY